MSICNNCKHNHAYHGNFRENHFVPFCIVPGCTCMEFEEYKEG